MESRPSTNKAIKISNSDGSGSRELTYEDTIKLIDHMQNTCHHLKKQNEKLISILKDNNIDVKEKDLAFEKLDLNKDLIQDINTNNSNNISVEVLEKDEGDGDDIKMIIDQTGCTREVARSTLQKNNNDMVNTIIEITDQLTS